MAFGLKHALWAAPLLAAAVVAGNAKAPPNVTDGPTVVDSHSMHAIDAPGNVGNWMSYSRGWGEQRYSPLTQINDTNVGQLGLAWYDDLGTYRGVQASPLVIDGVLYNESIYNVVTAYDGKTGRKLWTYDPKVGSEWARLACCGPSARGIAAWKGKLYIGALDGRLIAIDAKTGREVWSVHTFDPKDAPYSITGAPRVYDGKVVIGNGGADYGSRGFVSAWDAETGKKAWKFYIVPTDPAKGPDHEASDSVMAMATKTWSGKFWEAGGGGNAWDSFAYDPETRTVIDATGNASPHKRHIRTEAKADN
jgi:quinohemoprotein ethanol dehydrogenase